MEEVSVLTSADFVDGRRVEINENGTRNMLVVARLGEEGFEGTSITNIRVGNRATVSLEAVFEEIPGVSLAAQFKIGKSGGQKVAPHNSQAALPSCVPAWPMCRWQTYCTLSVCDRCYSEAVRLQDESGGGPVVVIC